MFNTFTRLKLVHNWVLNSRCCSIFIQRVPPIRPSRKSLESSSNYVGHCLIDNSPIEAHLDQLDALDRSSSEYVERSSFDRFEASNLP